MDNTVDKQMTKSYKFDYTITVKTGDRPKRCGNTEVDCILKEDDVELTKVKLGVLFSDDFKPGQLDTLELQKQTFPKMNSIEIRMDSDQHDWYIDTILVHNTNTKTKVVFPVYRWVRPGFWYSFAAVVTCLPQHDERKVQRQKRLEEKRKIYELEKRVPGLPPFVKNLPHEEQITFYQTWGGQLFIVLLALESTFLWVLKKTWDSIMDITTIYDKRHFIEPTNTKRWEDDIAFGLQRIAGVNNCLLTLCTQIPDKFGVTNEMVEPFLEGKLLPDAMDKHRIFIVDHSILNDCPTVPGIELAAPIALFYQRNDTNLVPIAIQLQQTKSEENPVFLPSDPKYTWIMAKMWFNNADACVHQSVTHYGFTHLLMEGVAVISHRYLSDSHPLFKLLAPHFRYVMAGNRGAIDVIFCPNGWADNNMSCGAEGGFELIRRHKPKWRMNVEGTLPEDLKARGVNDLNILPHYYFREDALLLFQCIKNYVSDYVNAYYTADDDVLQDVELQHWRHEMVKPEVDGGLGFLGVAGKDGKFTSKDQVVEVITSVIFTCSVVHAAANFKQYDEYAFPPNYPVKLVGKPPTSKSPLTEIDLLNALPDKGRMLRVMIMAKVLSQNVTLPLGDFEVNYIYDPEGLEVVERFRANLKEIGDIIRERNKARNPPYPYLNPVEVPNAPCI